MKELKASLRDVCGTGSARDLRRKDFVPAVLYGKKFDNIAIKLDKKLTDKFVQNPSLFSSKFSLAIDKKKYSVLVKEVQLHPVKDYPMHIDFQNVADNDIVNIFVPIIFSNQDKCVGIKRGGVLNVVMRNINIICKSKDIPQNIECDIQEYNVGKSINISLLSLPKNVKLSHLVDNDQTVAVIMAPSGMRSSAAAEAATKKQE